MKVMMMRRLVLLASAAWLLAGLMEHAAASSDRLTIEHFEYSYEPTGEPIVRLTLANEDTASANPTLSVTLKEAYSSGQDAYLYRKKGTTKPATISMAPGETRAVTLPVDKLLPYGDYEALVNISDKKTRSQERFEFTVSEQNVREAKLKMQTNHVEGLRSEPSWYRRKWLPFGIVATVIVCLSAIALTLQSRRDSRRRND